MARQINKILGALDVPNQWKDLMLKAFMRTGIN
jgi:hypothetical protein